MDDEARLLEILLSELRANGTAAVARLGGPDGKNPQTQADRFAGVLESEDELARYCERLTRTSQVQILTLGADAGVREVEGAVNCTLAVNGPTPTLIDGNGDPADLSGDDPFDRWVEAVLRVLQLWV